MKRLSIVVAVLFLLVGAVALAEEARVQIIEPADGAILRGRVEITAEGTGFRDLETLGVAVFEYSSDGTDYSLIGIDNVSYDGFSTTWDTTKVPDGEYRLRVTITDLWNTTAQAEIEVWIDNERKLPRTLRVPQAFATIQEALAEARPHDTIEVDGSVGLGLYIGNFTVDVPQITIEAVNGPVQLQRAADYVVRIRADSVTFRGFTVSGGGTGIVVAGDHVLLEGNLVSGNEEGILLSGARNCILKENEVTGNERWGIMLSSASGNLIEGNTIDHNGYLSEPGFGGLGVFLLAPSSGNTFRGNTISRNGTGMMILSDDNVLEGNAITGNFEGVMLVGNRNHISGNLISSGGQPASIGIAANGFKNMIEGNRISGHHGEGTGVGIWLSFPGNTVVRNDIQDNDVGIGLLLSFSGPSIALQPTQIAENNIVGNSKYGIENPLYELAGGNPITIDARNNWWGDPSGPFHLGKNPQGKGDRVSDNVDFEPWLTAPVEIPQPGP
ncbi:MAG: right-handed parallel beta-helix repeat-containing protein [Candidatus Bipolaricaulia bacterium]